MGKDITTMTDDNIIAYFKTQMAERIESVINGDTEKVSLLVVRPGDVISYLQDKYDISDDYDFDTNGWEWDFWQKYDVNGNTYQLSGDGYYSKSITFRKV